MTLSDSAPAAGGSTEGEGIRVVSAANALSIASGLFDINAAYTVAGWVRATIAEEMAQVPLFTAGDGAALRWDTLYIDDQSLMVDVGNNNDEGSASAETPLASGRAWHHVAYVREDLTTVKGYVDGALAVTLALGITAPVAASHATLANYTPDGADAVVGADFAQWRVWTAALSAGELAAETASATAVKTSGLWADWRMAGADEGERLADSSGNGRDLTRAGPETGTFTDGPL